MQRTQLHPVQPGLGEEFTKTPSSMNMTEEEFFYMELSTQHSFCEGLPGWNCLQEWRQIADQEARSLTRSLLHKTGMAPLTVAAVSVGSALLLCCALLCCLVLRRQTQGQLAALKAELEAFRQAKEKLKGGEQACGLVAAGEGEAVAKP